MMAMVFNLKRKAHEQNIKKHEVQEAKATASPFILSLLLQERLSGA